MKKDLVLQTVQNSVSSIFSKEDVINLINSIESSNFDVRAISRKLQDLQNTISYEFQNLCSSDVVDFDSVEFSIGYQNRIEVEDMNINIERLTEIVEGAIEEFDRELEEVEENEEVLEALANGEI